MEYIVIGRTTVIGRTIVIGRALPIPMPMVRHRGVVDLDVRGVSWDHR